MQFPVPQFTEVEDKIIGSLTIKQFGILFGVGILVFLGYSLTKSLVVAIFLFLVLGLPALGLALVPYNGRPMYTFIGKLINFILSTKQLVFHKEAQSLNSFSIIKNVQTAPKEKSEAKTLQTPKEKIQQIEKLLSKTAAEEKEVAKRMK